MLYSESSNSYCDSNFYKLQNIIDLLLKWHRLLVSAINSSAFKGILLPASSNTISSMLITQTSSVLKSEKHNILPR